MGKISVGTTSWTEKTLIESGLFYPLAAKTPEDRLKYYATMLYRGNGGVWCMLDIHKGYPLSSTSILI
jgi:hypothetical protein